MKIHIIICYSQAALKGYKSRKLPQSWRPYCQEVFVITVPISLFSRNQGRMTAATKPSTELAKQMLKCLRYDSFQLVFLNINQLMIFPTFSSSIPSQVVPHTIQVSLATAACNPSFLPSPSSGVFEASNMP